MENIPGIFYLKEAKNIKRLINSLDHLFEKGSKQSSRIVVDVIGNNNTNYILGNVKDAFERYSELSDM